MLLTSSWVADILLLFTTVTILLYKYSTRKYDFWKKRGIFYIKPTVFFGNAWKVFTFRTSVGEWLKEVYDSVDEPFFGIFIFDEPFLILKSPDLIKRVLVKDFNHFTDRTIFAPDYNQLISCQPFFQKGPNWKVVRPKLTPFFTSGKLRGMFSVIKNVGTKMNKYIKSHSGQQEAKEICAKYSIDIIAKCAFAINANCFTEKDAAFRKIGRSFFDATWRNAISQTLYFFKQGLANLLHLQFFEKWSCVYVTDIFWEAIKKREETNVTGNDLIDIIVEMRKDKGLCNEINFRGDRVVAHGLQFFSAGFETVSSTMAFTLYELCINSQIQDRLRNEIQNSIKEHNGITYEGIQNMTYLNMCVMETLRKYPVLPFLDRMCNENYRVPGSDFVIEKGTQVYIPMLGLHHDEKYYPNPSKYDPERFGHQNSYNVDGLFYLPFGEGPRICLGERFGLLGTKLGIVSILSEFVVERTPDTPVPLKFDPKNFIPTSIVGLPMEFKELCTTSIQ